MAEYLENSHPLLSFGVIADVQYADIDDGTNYTKTRNRYYRNSLSLLKTAIADWTSKDGAMNSISFVLDLGDVIDGFNAKYNVSSAALNTVTDAFDQVGVPVYHLWGNHDLYNFTRKQLYEMPKMNPYLSGNLVQPKYIAPYATYFDYSLCPGFRLVAIDPYEVSLLGMDAEWESYRLAENILKHENKNDNLNSPNGLKFDKKRFVKFNGAVSDGQLKWLNAVLSKAQACGEVVLVAGHIPLYASDDVCLCWNYKEILAVLHRYSCVLAYFAGHAHDQMYAEDRYGIHHLTFQGVIETEPGTRGAHSTIILYKDRVVIVDSGMEDKMELLIKNT